MKFGNLLKKELGELITLQAMASMIMVLVLYAFLGQVMGGAMEEGFDTSTITLCNRDNSAFTLEMLDKITEDGSTVIDYVDIQGEDYAAELERLDKKNVIIIPEGYGDSVLVDKKPAELIFVSELATGFGASMSSVSASDAVEVIEEYTTNEIYLQSYGLSAEEIERIKEPVSMVEYTVANGKSSRVSSGMLQALMMMQSMIAPFAIFFLLMMASQMIMTAISTEKIDKTLETLLSTPVSRMTVLLAKMTAAVVSALLNAVFMIGGFGLYMVGMMGSAAEEIASVADGTTAIGESAGEALTAAQAMAELGMNLSAGSYVLFGLQLFLTIAIGLSVALILGAMAGDAKSVQNLTMPIMLAVMVPFFVTMFIDMSTASMGIKVVMFLIPFTHSYTALTNLMNGDMLMFWGGFAYQIVFLVVCMFLAVRMFTTDKIFTMAVMSDAGTKKGGLFGKKKPAVKKEK
ncbi:MAG: ABC transporter permease [Oscillospiraceae bacterium]|nr:ABC transporter permease [Oscillospiraceae bacterium]